jgi:hypothetical protein
MLEAWKFVSAHSCVPCALLFMSYDAKFGPAAQTPEQRAWVLQQMQAMLPNLKVKVTAYAQQLYERYIAGELSWLEVRYALDEEKKILAEG